MLEERTWSAPLDGKVLVSGDGAVVGEVSLALMKKIPPARERISFH